MLAPFNLPEAITLLITDELAAPADFLLYQVVNSLFKGGENAPSALILSTFMDLARWKSVSLKNSVNLATHISSKAVRFVDICEHAQVDATKDHRFSAVLDEVSQSLVPDALVVLDDSATLEWIGHSQVEVWRFLRKLRAICLEAGATLVIRHHVASPNDPDELFLKLVDLCSYHLDVRPLYSGRSGAVSGEIALHAGSTADGDSEGVKLIPRNVALQYRLTDNGPVYFEKGTSEGVL